MRYFILSVYFYELMLFELGCLSGSIDMGGL